MGWDIVAIGTNHKIDIDNPLSVGETLSPLLDGLLSIGYFEHWTYNKERNIISIPSDDYVWKEIGIINKLPFVHKYKLIIENESIQRVLSQVPNLAEACFKNENEREWFYSDISDEPYALYECESELRGSGIYFGTRIFKSIVEFDENFGGRWFSFEHMFMKPYSDISSYLEEFRKYIYTQLKVTGCDCAYYFPDQGYGDYIYDELNKNSDEWVEYLKFRQYLKDDDKEGLIFFNIQDYIKGNIILNENESVICFIDDFSDFKKSI